MGSSTAPNRDRSLVLDPRLAHMIAVAWKRWLGFALAGRVLCFVGAEGGRAMSDGESP